MVVAKPMTPFDPEARALALGETGDIELDIEVPSATDIVIDENGDVVVNFGDEEGDLAALDHDANLAEVIDEGDLMSLAADLVSDFENDQQSRSAWAESYVKGLDLLGMKIEERTKPWAGDLACSTPC